MEKHDITPTFRTSGLWLLKASKSAGKNVGNRSINSSWERRPTSCMIIKGNQPSALFIKDVFIFATSK
jgi:hypothetical protein